MGSFEIQIQVSPPLGGDYHKITMTVDTGAAHSALPTSFLERVGISPDGRRPREYELADSSIQLYKTGEARFGIRDENGRVIERTSTVIFANEGCCLLGATTLQELGLSVDTEHHRLVEAPLSLAGFRGTPSYLLGSTPDEQ